MSNLHVMMFVWIVPDDVNGVRNHLQTDMEGNPNIFCLFFVIGLEYSFQIMLHIHIVRGNTNRRKYGKDQLFLDLWLVCQICDLINQ